jgi:hypothetical protein
MSKVENLKCNEESKMLLLAALVRYKTSVKFSTIDDGNAFPIFTTTYQLRKALTELIAAGYVETGFKGHNRYGYTTYKASEKGIKRFINRENAQAVIDSWIKQVNRNEIDWIKDYLKNDD